MSPARSRGNGNQGIRIAGPIDCTIGGTTAAAASVIGANANDGINLNVGSSNGLIIEGNFIGTDSAGTINLGNKGNGINIGSDQITIGGTVKKDGNVIAYNSKAGVAFGGGLDQDSILTNSIHDNGGLGISFGNGPTPNHLDEQGFTLPQPNDYQNYPVLTSAVSQGTSSEIVGSLNAGADTSYLIQFFASPAADASGHGQGQVYLGSTTATTGSNSDANDVNFNVTLTNGFPAGWLVSATATDPNGNTSEFSQDVAGQVEADVGVAIAASPTPTVYAGGTLTYTLTVSSNGPETAENVDVSDTLPQAIGPNPTATCSVAGVTPTISDGVVTANLGTMAANTTATVTIVVQLTGAAVPQVSDTASVTTSEADTNPANNSDTLLTTVTPSADLALTLVESPSTVYIGSPVTYSLRVTNNGPSDATNVVATDTFTKNISSSVTVMNSVPGITPDIADGQVTASLGTLDSGASASVTITVQPLPAAVPQISDSATVASGTYDPDMANDTPPAVTTTVDAVSDLQVGISAGTSPVPAGQDVTYTITATNGGPSDAIGVSVANYLPDDVTFVSATGGAEPVSGLLTFDVGNLAVNAPETFEVTVKPSGTTASAMSDMVAITGDQYDPNMANSTMTLPVPITPVSNLSLTLDGPSDPVGTGTNVRYTIAATNIGPSTDPNAVVVDTLPANVTFESASGGLVPISHQCNRHSRTSGSMRRLHRRRQSIRIGPAASTGAI